MANFEVNTFHLHDDYMTPKSAWESIAHLIPNNNTIWEPFYGDGKSGDYLRELGFNVIHEPNVDFFEHNKGDIIITNPPFSKAEIVLKRLVLLDKPFIIILPVSKLTTGYFKRIFESKHTHLNFLIPKKRIQFLKMVNGETTSTNKCNFDCLYYCYKIQALSTGTNMIWL